MCCDTTASNTGRYNGACSILEQKMERELLLFACRHHVYELVLKSIFEAKIPQVTRSPDIPLFKKFKDNWKNVNPSVFETCPDFVKKHVNDAVRSELLGFYWKELKKNTVRDDYRELIELSVIYLGGDSENKLKIKPPGAMHQARWMARAIYAIKMFFLKDQIKISAKDKRALQDVSLFIATSYVKPWLQCNMAVKAPNQDLCFLKTLKRYEAIDKVISKAALDKFCKHLWYLTDEVAILAIFDDELDDEVKIRMISKLEYDNEKPCHLEKRYVPSKQEIANTLFTKCLDDFVSTKSKHLFTRLKIDTSFLSVPVLMWSQNDAYLNAKSKISTLRAVNDTAERAVKLMQDFHGLITADEEQKQFLLRCVQEHRKLYPDCKKATLRKMYPK
ncbi:uncharacterized protein LOC134671472 [Cydia fagiglandana]|uniref:uncharacterized protein LOC134671472 n=2 Tax=Cydia TaxID=82599 RepID=UPI002FEE5FC1